MITLRLRSVMWFTAGLVLTLALVWGSLTWRAIAAPGAAESTIVAVTPTRILDSRDPQNLGLPGPFVSPISQKLQVTGQIAVTGGVSTVVPVGATGVLLNVTVVSPSAGGFLSIRPGDATGAPTTSSLNFAAGVNVPNAVQVVLPIAGANAGQIDIVYDASGAAGPTTDVLVDVVGYTTNAGLQELVADVALKASGYASVIASSTPTGWGPGALVSVQVSCPSGMVPTGGGGSNSSGLGEVALADSRPTPFASATPSGWLVWYKNVAGVTLSSVTIRAHATCMRVPGQPGADSALPLADNTDKVEE
jgi:hypothetical protein